MLESFQLGAITRNRGASILRRIPLEQSLQDGLTQEWSDQYDRLSDRSDHIPFDPGYTLDDDQVFIIHDVQLPSWLSAARTVDPPDWPPLQRDEPSLMSIRGTAALSTHAEDGELVLFQNFSRGHVMRPKTFLLLERGTYTSSESAALSLDSKLSAVYIAKERALKFLNYRTVNTFLSLEEYFQEATSKETREILQHPKLYAEDIDRWSNDSNQWFRKRFALLHKSTVLSDYSIAELCQSALGHNVSMVIEDERILFPKDSPAAKKLLQLLTEELFLGAISGRLYETNSKRPLV